MTYFGHFTDVGVMYIALTSIPPFLILANGRLANGRLISQDQKWWDIEVSYYITLIAE